MIVNKPEQISEKRLSKIEYSVNDFSGIVRAVREIVSRETIERKNKNALCSDFATLDIETSSIARLTGWNNTETDLGFLYLAQMYIGTKCFIFRTIENLVTAIEYISEILNENKATLVIYVHNLSFEWQFLKSYIQVNDVFAIKARRIARIYAYNRAIEFRCSYLLSNMSLEKFTENYCDEQYRKDKELIDYEIMRYPWSELDNDIIYYSLMDVITLYQAVSSIMNREGDTLATIPMTNTGYVRRACRDACLGSNTKKYNTHASAATYKKSSNYRKMFNRCALNLEQYNMCVQAFRGGNTHASRFYANRILHNVGSYDFASSYPAVVICSDEFPIGKLMDCTKSVQNLDSLKKYAERFFMLIEVEVENLRLRNNYDTAVPYIPVSKVSRETSKNSIIDNGRIIYTEGITRFTILGLELGIVLAQYTGKMRVVKAYYTEKGYLPIELRKMCYEWFEKKTSLKHVIGMEYEYMKSKNRVNSVYGMMVEQIIKEITEYCSDDQLLHTRKPTDEEAEEQLKNYYTPMQRKFLAYQWGITVTAVARARLQEMIDICGHDFVYCDTDSCKMLNPEKYLNAFEEYNKKWVEYASKCGCEFSAYTKSGELQTLGIADFEGIYDRFKTLGAKKYAVEEHGKLEITIAGVPKKAGAAMLKKLENFRIGYKFETYDSDSNELRQNWKKQLTYNDDFNETFLIDGHELHIQSNVALLRTTYILSITDEYEELINSDFTDYYSDDIF